MKKFLFTVLSLGFSLTGLVFTIRSIFDKSQKKDENNIITAMVCTFFAQIINILIRNEDEDKSEE